MISADELVRVHGELLVLFHTWRDEYEPGIDDPVASEMNMAVGQALAARTHQANWMPEAIYRFKRFYVYADARMGGASPHDALAKADATPRDNFITLPNDENAS